MMEGFIGKLADKIVETERDLRSVTVVLPTQRASKYLTNSLAEKVAKNTWLPRTTTLNQWIAQIAALSVANPIELKFHFYQAYQSVLQAKSQSITECFSWCDVLIRDFNNIDSQLIASEVIFKELADYNEIEYFSFLDEPLSEAQIRYKDFWKQLPKIHLAFKSQLEAHGLGYPGMILEKAIAKAEKYFANEKHYTIVAGLNALSDGEAQVLKLLEESKKGAVYYDGDAYYIDSSAHHAGHFLRNNARKEIGEIIPTVSPLTRRKLQVQICQADFNFQQAELVGSILSELTPEQQSKTALVLADEGLLIPILSYLPEMNKPANITMGIGLHNAPFFSWIEAIFELSNHTRLLDGLHQIKNQTLAELIDHHFSKSLRSTQKFKYNWPAGYSSIEQLKELKNVPQWFLEVVQFVLAQNEHRINLLQQLCISLSSEILAPADSISSIQASKAIETLQQSLAQLHNFFQQGMDLSTLKHIVFQAIRSVTADLLGDPTDSLQIMGLLESRALSFERIIVCSVNENTLPKKSSTDSFIPFEIANYHKLPGKREKEAVYAYHFYRLLQHAEIAHLIFHTNKEGVGGGEKSRYIQQIELELAKQNPAVEIVHRNLAQQFFEEPEEEILVRRTAEVQNKIRAHIETRISATSINNFVQDPLNWFYSSVLKLAEPDQNELTSADYGTTVHKVLEDLFSPFKGKVIRVEDIANLKTQASKMLQETVASDRAWINPQHGTEAVYYQMAQIIIDGYLDNERKRIEAGDVVTFVEAEEMFEKELTVETTSGTVRAHFIGFVDRIEKTNGALRILDYKTGFVKGQELGTKKFVEGEFPYKPKVLQLHLYKWMAKEKYGMDIQSEIISLPNPKALLKPKQDITDSEGFENFEEELSELIKRMMDSAEDLVKNPKFPYAKFE